MQINDTNRDRKSLVVLSVVCGVLQLAIAPNVALGNGRANFALVLVACVSLMTGGRRAVLCGFFAGLFFDLSTTGPVGLMALLLTIAAYVMGQGGRNRVAEDPGGSMRLYGMVALAVSLAYHIAMLLVGQADSFVDVLFLRTLPTFVLDCLAFVPFVYFLGRAGGPAFGGRASSSRRGGGHFSTKGL